MTLLEMLIGEASSAPQSDVNDALTLLVTRRTERENEAQRATQYEAILPKCREALDRLTHLRDALPAAAQAASAKCAGLDLALKHLWAHQANKPARDQYPSAEELAAYNEATAALEREAAAARDEKIEAERAQAELHRDFLSASEELARLQRQEAALRPRTEEPQRPGAGFRLHGVR